MRPLEQNEKYVWLQSHIINNQSMARSKWNLYPTEQNQKKFTVKEIIDREMIWPSTIDTNVHFFLNIGNELYEFWSHKNFDNSCQIYKTKTQTNNL